MNLSIVIITLNEEQNLKRCLNAIPRDLDVVVLDSGSSDATEAVVKEWGGRFFSRKFDDYSSQKNHALSLAKHEWVLSLDADEVVDVDNFTHIKKIISDSSVSRQAYKIKRRLNFMNRTLKYGKTTDWPIRLFRKNEAVFEGEIHEKINTEKLNVDLLPGSGILHYSYSSLSDYFSRFNKYTTKMAASGSKKNSFGFKMNLYFRFWLEFVMRYFIRGGFLDKHPGYCYALISSMYSYIKYAKQLDYEPK